MRIRQRFREASVSSDSSKTGFVTGPGRHCCIPAHQGSGAGYSRPATRDGVRWTVLSGPSGWRAFARRPFGSVASPAPSPVHPVHPVAAWARHSLLTRAGFTGDLVCAAMRIASDASRIGRRGGGAARCVLR
ncbi:hypothetical protein HOT12_gp17 [Burkholderia phage vB_BmuP_KL4]|uniref:Uncharacterized protein n=1 Tax=Burkholderia phage vB_BmuP_KL4 TaxID=2115967 RepID=A0A2S1GN61_9CAUD|nr:hypothetical protein HOT12_gp17 [Burkholderia phage vB_BmuP_KL4]AWD90817.1 hypothetical protein [Burkholderia phage vB_BmuP_KL4]